MNMNIKYHVLGIMSGTSLDGIDLAVCSFIKNGNWKFEIKKAVTIKYPVHWRNKLSKLHKKNKKIISDVNIEYGQFLGETINSFLNEEVDFIASHGHTIFHQPENNYTLQIGDGKKIANITQIKTINNFRNLDIKLKGQGAPLVPVGDLHLFPDYKYCVNLGGFANISIKEKEQITAFDICPVNIVMNKICKNLNIEFDTEGNIAKKGNIITDLLVKLNNLSYYNKNHPKSLSREWVDKFIYPLLIKDYKSEDILHTFCEHIGIQIGSVLNDNSALFTGGGVFNTYLMSRISQYSKSKIIIPKEKIINFKEALIFAFLGVLKMRNEVNCLESVTGAEKDSCGGEINNPL